MSGVAERFDRQTYLPGWNQQKLAEATVILIGIGALGNAAAQALALAGVGRLILCDPDRIELSNLSRTPLFRADDIGRLKVDAAARALTLLAPDLQIDVRPQRLEHAIGLAEHRAAGLTLGCLDSRAARLDLAGRCALVRAAWIDGATGQWSGEVRAYLDPDGPCYGCGMDEATRSARDSARSCRIAPDDLPSGATAPLSLAVGAQMALLAVRHLMGLAVASGIRVIDGATGLVTAVRQARDPGCPFHAAISHPTRLPLSNRATVAQLLARLEPGDEPLAWQPFRMSERCRHCSFVEACAITVGDTNCPQCHRPLSSFSHLELNCAPADTALYQLGVAPGEIIAVRNARGLRHVELCTEEGGASCLAEN